MIMRNAEEARRRYPVPCVAKQWSWWDRLILGVDGRESLAAAEELRQEISRSRLSIHNTAELIDLSTIRIKRNPKPYRLPLPEHLRKGAES